jgi:tellurite resistance protein TehA-like permease
LNIALFLFNVTMISLRFYMFPDTFRSSITHPTESLFAPSAIVSFGVILIGCAEYGFPKTGYWFNATIWVMYWIYCVMAIIGSCGIYLTLYVSRHVLYGFYAYLDPRWSTQTFTIAQMTPVWVFPAYPLLIAGPMAGVLVRNVSQPRALQIVISGVTLQGIGFMISAMVYSAFIYRLMTQKLPQEFVRPGMFVSVGPSGFTVSGLINMARSAEHALPADFMGDGKMTAFILQIMANWVGIWLWGCV